MQVEDTKLVAATNDGIISAILQKEVYAAVMLSRLRHPEVQRPSMRSSSSTYARSVGAPGQLPRGK